MRAEEVDKMPQFLAWLTQDYEQLLAEWAQTDWEALVKEGV